MSVAGIAQTVSAQTVATVVGGGGVQSGSGHHSGSSMVDGSSSMDNGISLGGNLVGVGIRCGHWMDGLHNWSMDNGCGVALDDRCMRNHSWRGIGGCQGGAIAQTVAMAGIGRDETGIGNGAQGGQDGNLQEKREREMSLCPKSFSQFVL